MTDNTIDDLALLDRPEVLAHLFYPRKDLPEITVTPKAMNHFIEVEEGIAIGCRFYPAKKKAPTIMYFHGNGETASDYDYVAPLYSEKEINLFVADYRGYGLSKGTPSATNLIRDTHPLFYGFIKFLKDLEYTGSIFIMGRSLGSVPAIELAFHYQDQIHGVIIESGFSSTMKLIGALGFWGLFRGIKELRGFGNGEKFKAVAIPALVIHGEYDRLIPLSEGKELYTICGSKDKNLVVIPRADHNDLMMKGRDQYFREIEAFIRKVSLNDEG